MNKSLLSAVLLSISLPAFSSALLPGDAAHGKTVHTKSCAGCHDNLTGGKGDKLYTRDNRRVTSLEGLMGQIGRCNTMQSLNLSEDDLNGLTKYLNETFSKFGD